MRPARWSCFHHWTFAVPSLIAYSDFSFFITSFFSMLRHPSNTLLFQQYFIYVMSGGCPRGGRPSLFSLRRGRVAACSRPRGPLPRSRRGPLSAPPLGSRPLVWRSRCLARRAHLPSLGGAEGAPLGLVRAAFLRRFSCSCLPLFLCPSGACGDAAMPECLWCPRPWHGTCCPPLPLGRLARPNLREGGLERGHINNKRRI